MRLIIIVIILAFISCNSKEYSLEKLAAAKWEQLEPGIDYIQTRDGTIKDTDSVIFTFKGISSSGLLISSETIQPEQKQAFSAIAVDMAAIIKQKLRGTEGYLKIDLRKFAFLSNPVVTVYLTGALDSITTANYLDRLRSFPGIENVEYISKEMAKKKFMGDNSGEDWEKILVDNPLPPSFDLTIGKDLFDEEKLRALKDSIKANLIYVDEVQLPGSFSKKDPIFYFIQYKLH
ncbi:MAG TPA: permease-like cell division protein FtsX [Chitinophagaceae bacterium]|jgi:hypothetical protein|nr:permease-like cell division protein FtsX [Chitinophagaceae bacterium]